MRNTISQRIIRKALNTGSYYPRNRSDLINLLKKLFKDNKFGPGQKLNTQVSEERTVIGGISPNAGYYYSGYASAYTFFNLFRETVLDTIIILGPDILGHKDIALMRKGEWETPLGNIEIDNNLSELILENCGIIKSDNSPFIEFPFARDHSIELQLPFIKYCGKGKNVRIVPIILPSRTEFKVLESLSFDLANVIKLYNKDVVTLAVASMSHKAISNEGDIDDLRFNDQRIINYFEQFDPEETHKNHSGITGNGRETITTLMLMGKNLDATHCKNLNYYTSYDVKDPSEIPSYCVGYFSGIIIKSSQPVVKLEDIKKPLDKNLHKIKEVIIDFSLKYSRVHLNEIIEKCDIADKSLIMNTIDDMIKNELLSATYFRSSDHLAFHQKNLTKIEPITLKTEERAKKNIEEKKKASDDIKVCLNCYFINKNIAKFCISCGKRLPSN